MIPQRMFPSEFSQTGLKSRVSACRKRLRENRVMLRSAAGGNIELFSGATDSGQRSPLEFESQQPRETVALLEEQEVGIT